MSATEMSTAPGQMFSREQQAIIEFTKSSGNAVVEAVAGAGKTYTIAGIAKQNADKRILVLTYNRTLCDETHLRFKSLGLRNVEVRTFHGFVYHYYDDSDRTDAIIDKTVTQDLTPNKRYLVDILVLDEFQDLNNRLFSFTLKLIRDLKRMKQTCPTLVFLGDAKQCIYESLHGSDSRYLTFAKEILPFAGSFTRFPLHTSRRLTRENAEFLNRAVLKTDLYKTVKEGGRKPILVTTDVYKWYFHEYIYNYIKEARNVRGISYDQIFILNPSNPKPRAVRQNPVIKLTNYLNGRGIPIHTTKGLDTGCDAVELDNKIVATTFHSAKGRERSLVIVMAFDESYFEFYGKNEVQTQCPNALYVALTRSTSEMILVRAYNKKHLPFLDLKELEATCEEKVLTAAEVSSKRPKMSLDLRLLGVTDLLEYCNHTTFMYLKQFYRTIESDVKIATQIRVSSVSSIMDGTSVTENVANLNGITALMVFENHRKGSVAFAETLQAETANSKFKYWKTGCIRQQIAALKPSDLKFPQDFVFLALLDESKGLDGAMHRFQQVFKRDWLSAQEKEAINTSLSAVCGDDIEFEQTFSDTSVTQGQFLTGRIDIIDHSNKNIIEVKYVEKITEAHLIQALLYWYLAGKNDKKYLDYTPLVFNIRDGTRVDLCVDEQQQDTLRAMVLFLFENKHKRRKTVTDPEFLEITANMVKHGYDPACMSEFDMMVDDSGDDEPCLFSDDDATSASSVSSVDR